MHPRQSMLLEAGLAANAFLIVCLLTLGWYFAERQIIFRDESRRSLYGLEILGEMAVALGQLGDVTSQAQSASPALRQRILAVETRKEHRLAGLLQHYTQLGPHHDRHLEGLRSALDQYQAARRLELAQAVSGKIDPPTHALERYKNVALISLGQVMHDERERITERGKQSQQSDNWFQTLFLTLGAVWMAVLVATYLLGLRLRRTLLTLQLKNKHLVERAHRNTLYTELSRALQTVESVAEAALKLSQYLQTLFCPHTGAVYLLSSSKNHLEKIAQWGDDHLMTELGRSDCLGLQREQIHIVDDINQAEICMHATSTQKCSAYVCAPLQTRGVLLGVMHVYMDRQLASPVLQAVSRLAVLIADQLALALANLQLRETLKEQSVRDSLTGLHNRRFLEESLIKEFARAAREQFSLAIFMLDVDHFKGFNDTYGHEAGDLVLRELGRTLKESVRGGELVCRFGGEEFTVILTHISSDDAQAWAQRLLTRVRMLEVKSGNTSLPKITLSMGMAVYPLHGTDPDTLLQAADLALYDAKRAGRDRLVVFQE